MDLDGPGEGGEMSKPPVPPQPKPNVTGGLDDARWAQSRKNERVFDVAFTLFVVSIMALVVAALIFAVYANLSTDYQVRAQSQATIEAQVIKTAVVATVEASGR